MDKLIDGRTTTTIARGLCAALALVLAVTTAACGSDDNSGGAGGQIGGLGGHDGGTVGAGGGGGAGVGGGAIDANSDAPPSAALSFPFTADTEGFALDTFANPGPYTDGNPQNLGGALDASAPPVVSFDGAVGMPAPGAVLITATFTDFNQTVNVHRVYPSTATISLAGKILTAQVRLNAGSHFTGTVHLFALSTPSPSRPAPGFYFAQGNSILLGDNNWHTLTFNLAVPEFAAAGFDASDVVQIGVQFASGAKASTGSDAASGPVYGAPQAVAIHFDSVN